MADVDFPLVREVQGTFSWPLFWRQLGLGARLCLALFCAMLWFGIFASSLLFQATLDVRNESGEVVYVTPIGRIGEYPYRLPTYSEVCPLPLIRQSRFEIRPGATRRLTYDSEETNVTQLIVEDAERSLHLMPLSLESRGDGSDAVIPPVTDLPSTAEGVAALHDDERNYRVLILLALLFASPVVETSVLARWLSRRRQKE